jgi:diaminopimelate epimerase
MVTLPFVKMHGLENDFVIVDGRIQPIQLSTEQIKTLAHRKSGIGCDQLLILSAAQDCDAHLRIFNADGSEAEACGNGTRCVAWLLAQNDNLTDVLIKTIAGELACKVSGDIVSVDMGPVIIHDPHINFIPVTIGNPHAVFVVDKFIESDWKIQGEIIDQRINTNVEFAKIVDRQTVEMKVWERGVGPTQACGSGACAVAAALHQQDLIDPSCKIQMDGGTLSIDVLSNNRIRMTGNVAMCFRGNIELDDHQ